MLPLGGPGDGAWITEGAAEGALRRTVAAVPGVRLGPLRLALADPEGTYESTVLAPPSALPPGPLRIEAECAATADEPLPQAAARLREALSDAAEQRLGLVVAEVDLRVTALLDDAPAQPDEPESAAPAAKDSTLTGDEGRAAQTALEVTGVVRLTGALGGLGRAVHIDETESRAALPRRHVRVELAVSASHRALDVTRAVREAVTTALPDGPTVSVLVTEVHP